MMTLLVVVYSLFAILMTLMGAGLAVLLYDYVGGHHSKKRLWQDIGIAALVGALWPLAAAIVGTMALWEWVVDAAHPRNPSDKDPAQ